ncbi:unnamed protein product, partial [Mycena citricolor]
NFDQRLYVAGNQMLHLTPTFRAQDRARLAYSLPNARLPPSQAHATSTFPAAPEPRKAPHTSVLKQVHLRQLLRVAVRGATEAEKLRALSCRRTAAKALRSGNVFKRERRPREMSSDELCGNLVEERRSRVGSRTCLSGAYLISARKMLIASCPGTSVPEPPIATAQVGSQYRSPGGRKLRRSKSHHSLSTL